jgi:type II secretory pathway component PulJ
MADNTQSNTHWKSAIKGFSILEVTIALGLGSLVMFFMTTSLTELSRKA